MNRLTHEGKDITFLYGFEISSGLVNRSLTTKSTFELFTYLPTHFGEQKDIVWEIPHDDLKTTKYQKKLYVGIVLLQQRNMMSRVLPVPTTEQIAIIDAFHEQFEILSSLEPEYIVLTHYDKPEVISKQFSDDSDTSDSDISISSSDSDSSSSDSDMSPSSSDLSDMSDMSDMSDSSSESD